IRAEWTASGACTNGSTAPPRGATRRASGGAATTSTTGVERRAVVVAQLRTVISDRHRRLANRTPAQGPKRVPAGSAYGAKASPQPRYAVARRLSRGSYALGGARAGLVGIAFAAIGYGRVSARRLVCKALHAW